MLDLEQLDRLVLVCEKKKLRIMGDNDAHQIK